MVILYTYETRAVVVSQGLGVTEGFEKRVGFDNDVLDFVDLRVRATSNSSNVVHDLLSSFSLSCTGFTTRERKKIRSGSPTKIFRSVFRLVDA
jgi:hypothetical protein